jgi:hypothetical protein
VEKARLGQEEAARRIEALEAPYRMIVDAIALAIREALSGGFPKAAPGNGAPADSGATNLADGMALIQRLKASAPDLPGVCAVFGALPPNSLITADGLATLIGRHRRSIDRAAARGELPPPIKFMGCNTWTAETIHRHFQKRLEKAAKMEQKRQQRRDAAMPS